MNSPFSRNRRDFLRRAACASLGATSASALLSQLGMVNAALAADACAPLAADDYKALVCVFLLGGNDSNNLLIPRDDTRYAQYRDVRGAMGLERDSLISINAIGNADETYALHPSFGEIAQLFDAGHAAFVVNTGTLIQPTTKAQYLSGSYPIPPQLFSHADQQGLWQYGRPQANGSIGWGGLVADRLQILNAGATIPMSISLSGQNRFQTGAVVQPYALGSAGPAALQGYAGNANPAQMAALEELLHQAYPDPLTRSYARTLQESQDYYASMNAALAAAPELTTEFPENNTLAAQLKMIARIIAARGTLKAKRQVFFVSLGGFDTHDDELDLQPGLFTTVSQALAAFYQATVELGVAERVTSFTMSEFSRTLNSDGDGSDHAWGGHQLVLGGAVKGQRLYGTNGASGGVFPRLQLDGPDTLTRGQMIPSTSADQYGATLARWMGLSDCDLAGVFPYLERFETRDLGFLA